MPPLQIKQLQNQPLSVASPVPTPSLTVKVASPQNLTVGNTTIAPGGGQTGVQAPPSSGSPADDFFNKIKNFGEQFSSGVSQGVSSTVKAVAQVPADITLPIERAIAPLVGVKPQTTQQIAKNPSSPLYGSVKAGATGNLSQVGNTAVQFAQFAPRAAVQIGESVFNPKGTVNTPKTGVGNILLGNHPIPSLQNVAKQQGAGGAAAQGLFDVAGVVGGLKGIDNTVKQIPFDTPLNEVGAVGKNVTPADDFTNKAESIKQNVAPEEPSLLAQTTARAGQTIEERQAELDAEVPKATTNLNKGAFTPEDLKNLEAKAATSDNYFPSKGEFNLLTNQTPLEGVSDLQKEQNLEESLGPENWNKLSTQEKADILGTDNDLRKVQSLSPEEAAIRVARGVKGRPGTFDQAFKAYMKKDPLALAKTPDQMRQETTQALESAGVTPVGGTKGEYSSSEPQLGVSPLPVDKEADVTQKLQPEKGIVKIESLETRFSKLGAPGREMVQRVTNARNEASLLLTRMRDEAQSFFDLNKADQATAWRIKEGIEQPTESTSPEVLQAVQDLKNLMPKIQQDGLQAGLPVGDRGVTYMPHIYPKGFFNKSSSFNVAIKDLISNGTVKTREQAIQLLNEYKQGDYMGGKVFSNLEKQRDVNLPGYKTDSEALDTYLQGTAKRIAQAHQFGVNNEEVTDLINRAVTHGQDGRAMQEIFNKYWNPDRGTTGALGKTAKAALKVQNLLQLQKSFIVHIPQGLVNIGGKYGLTRYVKGLGDQIFSPEARDYAHEAGVDAEDLHDAIGTKISNPFMRLLQGVRKINRTTAFIVGRNLAETLADRGDEAGLRELGISGDLAKDTDGRIILTDLQRIQASHFIADKTIFTTDPIQSSALVQGNLGKFIAQYRGQYVFKQAGFINNLLKDSVHGNVLPLIRYAFLASLGGVGVTVLKQLFEGKNPVTQAKKNLKSDAEQVLSNSGLLTVGAGGGEDIANSIEYHRTGNENWQNAASALSPSLGNVVEAGQNIDQALRGNPNPGLKQLSGFIPGGNALLNSRIGKDAGYVPPKIVTPVQQQFLTAWTNGRNQLNQSLSPLFSQSANPAVVKELQKTRDIANQFLDNDHTSDGKTILLNSFQKAEKYGQLVSDPKALAAVQQFEKSLPGHNPIWDLPTGQLSTYMLYEAIPPGDPNRTVLEQKDPNLANIFSAESAWASKQNFSGNTVQGNGYVPYPNITPEQQSLMNQVQQLAANQNRTPDQETQLQNLESNPDLQKAYALLDKYTNDRRALWPGVKPIPYPAQNLSPDQESLLQQESALPKGSRAAFIRANQAAWNSMEQILAQNTIYDVEKYGGVIQQGGTEPNFLKDVYNAGKYDIAKGTNAAGESTFVLNPTLAYSGGSQGGFTFGGTSAGGKSKKSMFLPTAKRAKVKIAKIKRPPRERIKRPRLAKQQKKINIKPTGSIRPVQVTRPTQVVKIAA